MWIRTIAHQLLYELCITSINTGTWCTCSTYLAKDICDLAYYYGPGEKYCKSNQYQTICCCNLLLLCNQKTYLNGDGLWVTLLLFSARENLIKRGVSPQTVRFNPDFHSFWISAHPPSRVEANSRKSRVFMSKICARFLASEKEIPLSGEN